MNKKHIDKKYIDDIINNINIVLKLKNIDLHLKIFRYKPYILIQDYKISYFNSLNKTLQNSRHTLNMYQTIIYNDNLRIMSCATKYDNNLRSIFHCSYNDTRYEINKNINDINIKKILFSLYLKEMI